MKTTNKLLITLGLVSILLIPAVHAANLFPTSLNDWVAGDIIEESWANALEIKIGADGSATTTSLDYLIKNSSSIDPGHLHSSSGISGTLTVAVGGTGATSLTDGGVLLGSGTGAITAMSVLADSELIVGDGTTDPVAESGATLRTSIGVSIGSDVQAWDAVLDDLAALSVIADNEFIVGTGAGTYANESGATVRTSLGLGNVENTALSTWAGTANIVTLGTITTGVWNGTDIAVADGGTGAGTFTDGGLLLGSGTGAITALGVAANGQIPIGDGTTDPVLATLTGDDAITITNGAGTIEIDFTPLASGADADSTTASSDSGLEIVSNSATLLRGCADDEILKWDETNDNWNCEADGGGGGGGGGEGTFCEMEASNTILPDSNFAAPGRFVGTNYNINSLDFDTATDESASWKCTIPSGVASFTTTTLDITWTASSTATGTVEWFTTYNSTAEALDWDIVEATTTVSDSYSTTTSKIPHLISQNLTNGNFAAGDSVYIKLNRDVSEDDLAVDAWLLRMILRWY